MTNSTYNIPTTNRKLSKDNAPDYMEINTDDAEAGSILMSLSQQAKQNINPQPTMVTTKTAATTTNTTNTMSIRNLLGDNDEGMERSRQYQAKSRDMATTTKTQEAKEIPPTYTERRQYPHGMHAQTTSPTLLPAASSRIRSTYSSMKKPTKSHNWQHQHQQQDPSPHTYYTPAQQQQELLYQQHHHQQQPIKPPYHHHDHPPSFSQQSYQTMRNNPKVRRNALHAYISYMTYSDLTRMKSTRPSYNVTPPMSKHRYYPKAPPPPSSTAAFERPPPSITSPPQQQQQPPLTAFLKHHQHVDPSASSATMPTTPRPNQPLPSIDNRHIPSSQPRQHPHSYPHHTHNQLSHPQQQRHQHQHISHPIDYPVNHPYHSPPPPQPQYHQAYPVLPYPPKHP